MKRATRRSRRASLLVEEFGMLAAIASLAAKIVQSG
jgi:hypothetical protein